jgi:hypothetical protein
VAALRRWQDDGMPEPVEHDEFIPVAARVHLSHAVVETLALDAGVDLLHIKGPALFPGLRPPGRASSDVDVLVAPGQAPRLEAVLAEHGWERMTGIESGSAFHHAANWFHANWGYVDVHAHWPGPQASPEEVFAAFAEGAHTQEIAHVACRVPNRTAQVLILVLHAARTTGSSDDLELAWFAAPEEVRADVLALAVRLRAETAFAAGLGELDSVTGDRTADLWRYYSLGGSRLDEWRARVRAAPSRREAAKVLVSAVLVNRDHLRMELGHPPSRREVALRQWQRVRVLGHELTAALATRVRGR